MSLINLLLLTTSLTLGPNYLVLGNHLKGNLVKKLERKRQDLPSRFLGFYSQGKEQIWK